MSNFLHREWSDAEKWGMGIASALVVAALVALASSLIMQDEQKYEFEKHRAISLLLGYDGAFALARSIQGQSIRQQKSQLDGYIKQLGIKDISYPIEPIGDNKDAEPASQFSQQIVGRLDTIDPRLKSAFVLGWYGVITTNTPDLKPAEFDIQRFATDAGYQKRPDLSDIEFLESLVEDARKTNR